MARIVSFLRTPEERLARTIRKNAMDSANVVLSPHARQRMDERDISDADILQILRNGDLRGGAEQTRERNGQKVKMVYRLRGNRDAGVVTTVFSNATRLIVVTVEWEDF
jgi:hypothetical protein